MDVYKYHILECRSQKMNRFVLPGYLSNTPSDSFPYDYIWSGYIYKTSSTTIYGTQYDSIALCVDETLNWKFFCIPR